MHSRLRAPAGASVMATALVISSGTGALAAEDPAAPASLCELVDVSGLSSLSGLAFEPALDQASICNLVSPADEGFHSVQLALQPGLLADQRQGDSVDLTLAGLPGVANVIDGNAAVYLDLGEGQLLRVGVTAGAVGSADLEPLDLGLSLTEAAAADLLGTGSTNPEVEEVVSLAPPDLEGLDMDIVSFDGDGASLQGERPGMAEALAPLLEAFAVEAEAMTVYQADSGGQSTAPGYQAYIAVRVAGAGGGELGPAVLSALGLSQRPDLELSEAEVGGRSVTVMRSPELVDAAVYLYDAGDTAYLLQMDEALAARLLAALP